METEIDYAEAKKRHPEAVGAAVSQIRKGKSKSKDMPEDEMIWAYSWCQMVDNNPRIPDPKRNVELFLRRSFEEGTILPSLVARAGRATGEGELRASDLIESVPAEMAKYYDPRYGEAKRPEWSGKSLWIWQPTDDDRPGLAEWCLAGVAKDPQGRLVAVISAEKRPAEEDFEMRRIDAKRGVLIDFLGGEVPKGLLKALAAGSGSAGKGKEIWMVEDAGESLGARTEWAVDEDLSEALGQLHAMGGFMAFGGTGPATGAGKAFGGAPKARREFKLGESLSEEEQEGLRALDEGPAAVSGADFFAFMARQQTALMEKEQAKRNLALGLGMDGSKQTGKKPKPRR